MYDPTKIQKVARKRVLLHISVSGCGTVEFWTIHEAVDERGSVEDAISLTEDSVDPSVSFRKAEESVTGLNLSNSLKDSIKLQTPKSVSSIVDSSSATISLVKSLKRLQVNCSVEVVTSEKGSSMTYTCVLEIVSTGITLWAELTLVGFAGRNTSSVKGNTQKFPIKTNLIRLLRKQSYLRPKFQ